MSNRFALKVVTAAWFGMTLAAIAADANVIAFWLAVATFGFGVAAYADS